MTEMVDEVMEMVIDNFAPELFSKSKPKRTKPVCLDQFTMSSALILQYLPKRNSYFVFRARTLKLVTLCFFLSVSGELKICHTEHFINLKHPTLCWQLCYRILVSVGVHFSPCLCLFIMTKIAHASETSMFSAIKAIR